MGRNGIIEKGGGLGGGGVKGAAAGFFVSHQKGARKWGVLGGSKGKIDRKETKETNMKNSRDSDNSSGGQPANSYGQGKRGKTRLSGKPVIKCKLCVLEKARIGAIGQC